MTQDHQNTGAAPCDCGPSCDDASCASAPVTGGGAPKESLSGLFRRCAHCAGPAAGGAILSHAGCVLATVFAGVSGVAAGAAAHAAMFVASPLIAAGVALGVAHWRGDSMLSRPTLTGAGLSAALALAVTFGISAFGGHDGHGHHSHGDHEAKTPAAAAAWFQALPAGDQDKIRDIAGRAGIDPADYVLELQGIPALSGAEKKNLRDTVGQTCPCQVPGACKIEGLAP